MDHPVFPKLPKSNVEGCKDPKSKIWALYYEKWPFYSRLKIVQGTIFYGSPCTSENAKIQCKTLRAC